MIRAKGMGAVRGGGAGRADIFTHLPIHIECKCQETIKFWDFWGQASSQCPMGHDPVLAISANHRPILVVMEIDYWLNLLKTEQEYLADV